MIKIIDFLPLMSSFCCKWTNDVLWRNWKQNTANDLSNELFSNLNASKSEPELNFSNKFVFSVSEFPLFLRSLSRG